MALIDHLEAWANDQVSRLVAWMMLQVKTHPWLYEQLEGHLHPLGLHGPYVRHELRTRLLPTLLVLLLSAVVLIVSSRWRRAARPVPAGRPRRR